VAVLQHAYSGERAAILAYRGHWKSLRDPVERERVRAIEDEESHHRRLVGEMLAALGGRPRRWLELRALLIGGFLGPVCRVSGWFAPMYGAGRLESHNVREYEVAARHAADCGRAEFIDCLLTMAEVEWEHERFFREKVLGHPLARLVPIWAPPPPKETIRALGPRPLAATAATAPGAA
jgi:hypothetical protein